MSEDLEKDFYNYLAKSDSTKSVGFVINQYINEKLKKRDDFAIKFAEWKDKKYWYSKDNKSYIQNGLPNSRFNLTELLQIFKEKYYE